MIIKCDRQNRFKLWLQWIVANAMGELLGLGTVSIVALFLASRLDESVVSTLLFALLMILLGAFEGIAIGLAQWIVLRKIISRLTKRSWINASLIGAVIAWTLEMLPSTVINLAAQSESIPLVINEVQVILLASITGVVLGFILALPQWLVLRRYVRRANWWLGANSVAWAFGLPLIFLVAGTVTEGAAKLQIIATLLLAIATAGGIVGAIHGIVLVWVLRLKRSN